MDRRRFLSALGIAAVSGCLDDQRTAEPSQSRTSTARPTVPANVTVLTETKPLPSPPDSLSPASARSFVATHEERFVYNELVGDGEMVSAEGYDSPTSVEVEPATVRLLRETADGYFLVSACTGSADYYCEEPCSRRSTRNAHDVVHFVGPDDHRRVPFNAYSCEEPGPAATAEDAGDDGADDPEPARFQLYDFQSEMDYEHPTQGGQLVDVRVADAAGATALDRTYRTSLPLSVQTGVVAEPGDYELTATLEDDTRVVHEWDLSEPGTPPWWALSIFITPAGDLFATVVDLPGGLGPPRSTLCRRA